MKIVYSNIRVILILLILISLFFVNNTLGQDNVIQSNKFKIDLQKNPKLEFRNSKQLQMTKIQNLKT